MIVGLEYESRLVGQGDASLVVLNALLLFVLLFLVETINGLESQVDVWRPCIDNVLL